MDVGDIYVTNEAPDTESQTELQASAFPDASNTGVPKGTELAPYTGPMTITQDGTIIEGKHIEGTLVIRANRCIVRKNLIETTYGYGVDMNVDDGRAIVIADNTFRGAGSRGVPKAGIIALGTIERNDISGFANGITLKGGTSIVRDNYIHDLEGEEGEHIDGIEVQGYQRGVIIDHNTIMSWHTSCILIKGDFGPISGTRIINNLLINQSPSRQTGFPIYSVRGNTGDLPTGTLIEGNTIEPGYPGYFWQLEGDARVRRNWRYDPTKPGFRGMEIQL